MNNTPRPRKWLPWLLIAIFSCVIGGLYLAQPKQKRNFSPAEARILVDVKTVETVHFQPIIKSYGIVEPLIQSQVVAQVGGRIVEVSEAFRDGGFFTEGEVLLRIDAADYEIELAIAQASLAEAERNLQEQTALAEQAKQDWQRLGRSQKPSALTLREPQLASAQANVASAKASVEKANLNLLRTKIVAPFDGRALNKNVDIGEVVNPNTILGTIFASNGIEVRLPIKNADLAWLNLPERYRHQQNHDAPVIPVNIISELTQREVWPGQIVRTAGAVDNNSRQLYVVARVNDPFGKMAEGRFPLKIGQYVKAEIPANPLPQALVIPISSIYQGTYIYVFRDGVVHRRDIQIRWQDNENAIIHSGLTHGEKIVLSPLGQVASGTPVKLKDPQEENSRKAKGGDA